MLNTFLPSPHLFTTYLLSFSDLSLVTVEQITLFAVESDE